MQGHILDSISSVVLTVLVSSLISWFLSIKWSRKLLLKAFDFSLSGSDTRFDELKFESFLESIISASKADINVFYPGKEIKFDAKHGGSLNIALPSASDVWLLRLNQEKNADLGEIDFAMSQTISGVVRNETLQNFSLSFDVNSSGYKLESIPWSITDTYSEYKVSDEVTGTILVNKAQNDELITQIDDALNKLNVIDADIQSERAEGEKLTAEIISLLDSLEGEVKELCGKNL